MSNRFQAVFIVAGNHEFYNTRIDIANEEIEKLEKLYNNVYFLNKSKVEWNGLVFLGIFLKIIAQA